MSTQPDPDDWLQRRVELEARLDIVEQACERQAAQERTARWLFAGVPAVAIVVAFVWSKGPAIAVALSALFFAVVVNYVIWTHREAYHSRRASVRAQLEEGDARAAGRPEPERPRWRGVGKPTQLFS